MWLEEGAKPGRENQGHLPSVPGFAASQKILPGGKGRESPAGQAQSQKMPIIGVECSENPNNLIIKSNIIDNILYFNILYYI